MAHHTWHMGSQAGTLLFNQQMDMDAVQDKDEAKTIHRRETMIILRNSLRFFRTTCSGTPARPANPI